MSSRDYLAALEEEDPREDEVLGEPEDEPAAPRANVTLDLREIRGRPDDYGDDAIDVAESEARKGPSGSLGPSRARARVAEAIAPVRESLREFSESPTGTEGQPADWMDYLGARRVPRVLAGAAADVLESGAAIPAGLAQGATLNLGDDIYGAMEAMEGRDFTAGRESARTALAGAREGSPGIYDVSHALGATGTALAVPAVGAESALGRIAGEGALNAGMGFVEGVAGYEGDDFNEGMGEALSSAAEAGAFGAIGRGLLGEALPAGARALGRFGDQADRLRVGSVMGGRGANPLSVSAEETIANLPGGIPAAAERIRRLGIGSTLGTAEDAATRSGDALERIDDDLAAYYRALEEANPEGIHVARLVGSLAEPAEYAARQGSDVRNVRRIADVASDFETAAANRGSEMYPIREAPTPARPEPGGLVGDFRRMRERMRPRWGAASDGGDPAIDAMVYRALRGELDRLADETVGGVDRFRELRNDRVLAEIVNEASSAAAAREARGLGPLGRAARTGTRFGPLAGVADLLSNSGPSMRATAAETVRSLLSRSPEALGVYGPIFARALTRGGPDLLEAVVARSVESDPELGMLLSSPEMTDEEVNAALDDFFSAPGGEPEMTDEEVNAALDDFFSTEN